ncbi:VWA domain-containing protein [Bdellovibrio sp. HCB337]|uniref:VWA domain-containing protein n=1 Tax=Bdellovibrio sp. HCB337 TaxID=3394358 RepID=UPI0039A576AC
MKRAASVTVLSGIFLTFMLSFQNCSKVGFTSAVDASAVKNGTTGDGDDDGGGDDTNCRIDMVNSTKTTKILFLIDTSGSNAGNNGAAGTDMGKTWRLATINSFINAYASKPNFQFGFATFQETSAKALLESNNHGIFTNNMTEINQAIQALKDTEDQGNTPYDAALSIVKDMISYDQVRNPSKEVGYVVIMVSDGSPTNKSYTNEATGMTALTNDVKAINNVAVGQISVNTVYLYNQSVPSASQKSYLQKIASVGHGAFIEASSQQIIQISDTVQVPTTTCM